MGKLTKYAIGRPRPRDVALCGVVLAVLASSPHAAISAGNSIEPRLAYLDPGTGSLILQAIVAVLAGAAVAITSYWQKIRAFFGRNSRNSDPSDTAPSDD